VDTGVARRDERNLAATLGAVHRGPRAVDFLGNARLDDVFALQEVPNELDVRRVTNDELGVGDGAQRGRRGVRFCAGTDADDIEDAALLIHGRPRESSSAAVWERERAPPRTSSIARRPLRCTRAWQRRARWRPLRAAPLV